jgi:PilX N-terminal
VKKTFKCPLGAEGSILVVALFMMCILMIVGMAAATTALIEQRLSGNQKFQKMAFYASEAARNYVASEGVLYGSENLSVGEDYAHFFPNPTNPYVADHSNPNDPSSARYALNAGQSFNGTVEFTGTSPLPRGSGFEEGAFKAYNYRMKCYGYGPANARSEVEVGFYRVGH